MRRVVRVLTRAPSNIALIKYMGKKDAANQLPDNGSLSMTLDRLCSFVELSIGAGTSDPVEWLPELPEGAPAHARVPELEGPGILKVRRHVERVREAMPSLLEAFGLGASGDGASRQPFVLRTANTFPQASGIASSASSFAALTLAVAFACARDPDGFNKIYLENKSLVRALAALSRYGSGSSCRSFEGPWVEWEGEETHGVTSGLPELRHLVLVVSEKLKRVSSSQAHLAVKTSPLWQGRVERATARRVSLKAALALGELATISRIAWAEAWEMHSLFHTASQPFSYWEGGTMDLLQWLAPAMQGDSPPIVTLDAGPNTHLTCLSEQLEHWKGRIQRDFPGISVLEDQPGVGARLVQVQ